MLTGDDFPKVTVIQFFLPGPVAPALCLRIMYGGGGPMASQNHTYTPGPMINLPPQGELGHITAKWIAQCENGWLPDQAHLIGYLKAIQEREATGLVSTVNSNTQALRKITEDIDIMKKAAMNKASNTSSTPFKDALLRVPSKHTPSFKQHEIIVKVGRDQANFLRGEEEEELVKNLNLAAVRSGVENIDIRAVNKLPSGDLAIQTRDMEETRRLRNNKAWVTSLYGDEARAVSKTFPMLVHTCKMKVFRTMELAAFIVAIKNWNGGLEPIHVKPLQPRDEGEHGALIFTFRSIADAEEARIHGIVMAGAIHPAELYNRECRMRQCFKCQGYGHFSIRCTNNTKCGRCAHEHNTSLKNKPEPLCLETYPDKCANCGQGHPSWSKQCPLRKKEYERIRIARLNTPEKYTGEDAEDYCRDSIDSTPMNLDVPGPEQEYTIVEARGRKKAARNNTVTPGQSQNHDSSINPRLDAERTPQLQPNKKARIDNRSRSPRKADTPTQTKQVRQPLLESNHIINTRSVDSSQKRATQEFSQGNDENRPFEIPSSFPSQISSSSDSSQW